MISSVNDAQKNRNKIFGKLIRHKLNELRKKITTGVNDFDLLSDKKKEDKKPNKVRQMFISFKNDIYSFELIFKKYKFLNN